MFSSLLVSGINIVYLYVLAGDGVPNRPAVLTTFPRDRDVIRYLAGTGFLILERSFDLGISLALFLVEVFHKLLYIGYAVGARVVLARGHHGLLGGHGEGGTVATCWTEWMGGRC